jgi:O-antigen/teichoic acid export membrane protein
MLRKLLSHAVIYGLAAQVPRVAGILALPIITKYLTPADYGVAGVVTAYVSAISILQSLGLSLVKVNSFARHGTRYKWVWRQLHGFLLLWGIFFTVILGGVLYLGIPEEASAHKWEIIALQCVPALLFLSTEFQAGLFYQMSQQPLPIALRSFVVGATVVALNIFTIAYLRLGYMGWFYANFFGSLLGFLIYGYKLYLQEKLWPIFRFKWHRIKSSLRIALPMVPHHFSFFLLDTSDRMVMDVLRVPVARIGFYNIASSFGLYFTAASGAIVQAAAPYYMKFYAKPNDREGAVQARNMTFALQALFLFVTFMLCLWLKQIFAFLIRNDALQSAYPLAIIILMGYNFRPMYLGAVNQLVYRERTKVLWKVSLVAGIANVVLNLILVPIYGIEAAALTTFAALMYMGYAGYFLKEYRQIAQVPYYPVVWLVATILALGIVYGLADSAIPEKLAVSLFVVAVAGGAFLYFRKQVSNM